MGIRIEAWGRKYVDGDGDTDIRMLFHCVCLPGRELKLLSDQRDEETRYEYLKDAGQDLACHSVYPGITDARTLDPGTRGPCVCVRMYV